MPDAQLKKFPAIRFLNTDASRIRWLRIITGTAQKEAIARWTMRSVSGVSGALSLRRAQETNTIADRQSETRASEEDDLPVLGFAALVERTATAASIERLRIKLGFPREVFEYAVRPVIEGYTEYVQLLPAPESPEHAEPGGLLRRALAIAGRALDYRRGQILPRGAAPEVIGGEAHRWTYAVFVAALLHDVDRNIAAVRVLMRANQGDREPWRPTAGSLPACAAVNYRVECLDKAAQQPELLARLPVEMLERFVPEPVRTWLNQDPDLVRELLAFLSGDDSARTGAISELVLRAVLKRVSRGPNPPGSRPTLPQAVPAVGPASGNTPDETVTARPALADQKREYLEDIDKCARCPATPGPDGNHSREAVQGLDSTPLPLQRAGLPDPRLARASEVARRFLAWLQQGLADGRLRVNETGALVHFVPEGMLLVSPRIFREFANRLPRESIRFSLPAVTGEPDIGKWVQRQVLRAGWHLQAERGVNVLAYQVMRGHRPVSNLHGVVILEPGHFVNPVPPVNPVLVRLPSSPADV